MTINDDVSFCFSSNNWQKWSKIVKNRQKLDKNGKNDLIQMYYWTPNTRQLKITRLQQHTANLKPLLVNVCMIVW